MGRAARLRGASALLLSAALLAAPLGACGDDEGAPPRDGGAEDSSSSVDGAFDGSFDGAVDGSADSGADTGAPVDGGGPGAPCTDFADAVSLGNAQRPALDEISGVAASRSNADVLWVHNDSGDSARVFAMRTDGHHLGEYALTGATHVDWEDMTLGRGPDDGVDYLYLGDTGDNAARDGRGGRSSIVVYRVPEPAVDRDQVPTRTSLGDVEALTFVYPDAPHDCESVMVDHETADLYLLTKDNTGLSGLYVARAPLTAGATVTLERVGQFMFGAAGVPGGPLATAGDFARDGTSFLVRTYDSVLMFPRAAGSSWASSLSAAPVVLPGATERQGEAIAWVPDGSGYYTVSEFAAPPVHFYAAAPSCAP